MSKIITEFVNPPIPIRSFDWQATRDEWDLGDLIGVGQTELQAIDNLLEQEEDEV